MGDWAVKVGTTASTAAGVLRRHTVELVNIELNIKILYGLR
jgi:hypothetical protein